MTGRDYMAIIEKEAPVSTAYEWDHVGLMLGDPRQEVTGVLLCMDLTPGVLAEAAHLGANLVITHHPLIFTPLSDLGEERTLNRRITEAIRQNLTVLSYHTNLDRAPAPCGINYNLALALELEQIREVGDGFHYVGELAEPLPAEAFARRISTCLKTGTRSLYHKGPEALIKRVGVSCGAYVRESDWLAECGCDALVTGEAKQSELVELSCSEVTVYLSGHYATEMPGLRALKALLPGPVFVSSQPTGDGALVFPS